MAIADGGLENGAASISWALPVKYLNELVASREELLSRDRRSASLFAADLQSKVGGRIRCGDIEVTKLRTRQLADLAQSVDDPQGLEYILSYFSFFPPSLRDDILRHPFDIYQHLESGATIAVPAGFTVAQAGRMCVARPGSGLLDLKARIARVNSLAEAETQSREFQLTVLASPPERWQVDPQFTYSQPLVRFDGLMVMREGMSTWQPPTYIVETRALRANAFLGMAGTNRDPSLQTLDVTARCLLGQWMPQCQGLVAHFRDWALMKIAVHLTTFAIG